jgi:flagellar motor protein MotB
MSKKTYKTASANDSHHPTNQRQTGFTTADKLLGFDSIFNPDFAQNQAKKPSTKKEVRTQDPKSVSVDAKPSTKKEVRTQDPKSATAGTKKSTKTTKKPSTKKEVRTKTQNQQQQAQKKAQKQQKNQALKKKYALDPHYLTPRNVIRRYKHT